LKTLAILFTVLAADGGTPDAPLRVQSAQLPEDGGTLPEGWWLSDTRIKKVGEHVVKLENDAKVCASEKDALASLPCGPNVTWGFWAGVAVGAVAGAAGVAIGLNIYDRLAGPPK
jgi:hypothetical protein